MLWRKFKLDWSYALGELFIVTAGVLIALAIDQWNNNRQERAKEVEIIERLLIEVELDLENIELAESALEVKMESLRRVQMHLELGIQSVEDMGQFVKDVWLGQIYGWGQDSGIRTTFNELMGSGDFHLIHKTSLRSEISEYYFQRELEAERMNERESEYPQIVYRLIPRSVTYPESASYFGTLETGELVKRIFAEDVADEVLGEMNYAYFASRDYASIRLAAETLSRSLNSEIAALE
jgi:hypothetical protein